VFDQPRVLIALLFLFCIRVLGQILVAFFRVTFLPPMEEWFSGLLPYPELLTTQIPIIVLYGKICLDFVRGSGFFVTPRRRLGTGLVIFGSRDDPSLLCGPVSQIRADSGGPCFA
jgi:hypothetical protein